MGSCHRLGLARPAEPPGYTGGRKERGRGFEDLNDHAFSEAVRVTDYCDGAWAKDIQQAEVQRQW